MEASYSGESPEKWAIDKELSTKTSKVFKHDGSNQVVVTHRGTSGWKDWANNLAYGLAGETGYKLTGRYKEAKKVQKGAEKKYGADNITTAGHSQGGLQAQMLGKNSREIITVNKATRPDEVVHGSSKKKNQHDVRASWDPVSSFRSPLSKQETVIKSETSNPLTEHSYDVLNRLDPDTVIGDDVFGNGLYQIKEHTRKQAKKLGVSVQPSDKVGKKIDVIKEGKVVASIGQKGMKDYPTHLKEKGKKFADERREAYKKRHAKHRGIVGTPSYYADKLLW